MKIKLSSYDSGLLKSEIGTIFIKFKTNLKSWVVFLSIEWNCNKNDYKNIIELQFLCFIFRID